jgi:hypothetical protein
MRDTRHGVHAPVFAVSGLFRFWAAALLAALVLGIAGCGGGGGSAPEVPTPATISLQPKDQQVVEGGTANFSVVAAGGLTYQWQRSTDNGATFSDVAGASSSSFLLPAATLAADGTQFRVKVSNAAGSVTSSAARLTVTALQLAPTITTPPSSIAVVAPATASFTAVIGGLPAPTLQWQVSVDAGVTFTNLPGATGSSFTTAATVLGDSGHRYRVIATNTVGTATSTAAVLTVGSGAVAPAFTTQPVAVSITAGQDAHFTAAASGTPTPTLQWQLSTNGGVTWSDIVGATGGTLDLLGVPLANNGQRYRSVATNTVSSVASNAALLTVSASAGKTWQTPLFIETDNAGDAHLPQVAVNAAGAATAVWHQSDGTNIDIYANRYVPGTGWGTALRIETDNAGVAQSAQVAMDSAGNAIAVWQQSDGTRNNIWSNRYVVGTGWGTATLIESGPGDAGNPQVAMDGSGNAIAVWWQHVGGQMDVMANRFVVGTGWGTEVAIEADASDVGVPGIAVDAAGNAMVVWPSAVATGGFSFEYKVWANRFAVGTGWGTATSIDIANINSANPEPQVAIDGSGNAIAVWHRPSGSFDSIYSNRFTVAGGWGTAALIETDDTNSARHARVAFDAAGNAVAVWIQNDGLRDNVLANRYVAGTGWGTPVLIETNNAGGAFEVRLAVEASGDAVAVWYQRDNGAFTDNVWTNRYTSGASWGTAVIIDNSTSPARIPQLGIDASGNVTVVWKQTDGARTSIAAGQYR